jgi:hypothetical protein
LRRFKLARSASANRWLRLGSFFGRFACIRAIPVALSAAPFK